MSMNQWKTYIKNWAVTINNYGGKILEFSIDSPATEEEVNQVEKALNKKLPKELKEVFLKFSKNINLYWSVGAVEKEFPEPYNRVFEGGCRLSLHDLVEIDNWKDDLINSCFIPYNNFFNSEKWLKGIGILEVGNGDYIVTDPKEDGEQICYISHEGDYSHGWILGKNLIDFLENWFRIGCAGPLDSCLEPFMDGEKDIVNGYGDMAEGFRKLFGVNFEKEPSDEEVKSLIVPYNDINYDEYEAVIYITAENYDTGIINSWKMPAMNINKEIEEQIKSEFEKSTISRLISFEVKYNENFSKRKDLGEFN